MEEVRLIKSDKINVPIDSNNQITFEISSPPTMTHIQNDKKDRQRKIVNQITLSDAKL